MTAPRRRFAVTLDAAGNWLPERPLVAALVARAHDADVPASALAARRSAAG